MPKSSRILPIFLAILFALTAVACGANLFGPTPTPLPTATPTQEFEQRPALPEPDLGGDIDVGDGHILSYQCWGKGSPTVIVEAGAGDKPTLTLSWNAVIQGVYPTTRICIYDRVPAATSQAVAENLHAMLGKIPLPGPYILVAHSLGGWHARVFTHLYPSEVAGLILVDTTLVAPDAVISYATMYPTYAPDEPAGLTQNRMSATDVYSGSLLPSMDGLDMNASNAQVRQAGSFGDLPLIVISQTVGPDDFPGLDSASRKQIAAIITKLQADLTKLSSRGIFVQAATSQHFISLYQPEVIIAAINRMVQEIRQP